MKYLWILVALAAVWLLIEGRKALAQAGAAKGEKDGAPAEVKQPEADDPRYVPFPAVGIKLIRPEGFDDAEGFYGFQQRATMGSVLTMKIPGPVAEVTRGFTTEEMQKRGMRLLSKQEITLEGKPALLVHVAQTAYGVEVLKWIVALGDETQTIMVTTNFPEVNKGELSEKLKQTALSARRIQAVEPQAGADLSFTIVPSAKLKATPGIGGKMLMYTKGGVIPAPSPTDPLFGASPSLGTAAIENRRQFAVQRAFQLGQTKISMLQSTTPVTVDGLEGFEILAEGEDQKSGSPVAVYQMMLFDGDEYFLMVGIVGDEGRDEYLPEFKAMAHSFARKKPANGAKAK